MLGNNIKRSARSNRGQLAEREIGFWHADQAPRMTALIAIIEITKNCNSRLTPLLSDL